LAQAIKPQRVAEVLVEFGMKPLAHPPEWYGLGIAIGTAEIRLLEATGAYATLGRECLLLPPTLTPQRQAGHRVADSQPCSAVLGALRDEDARVRGFGAAARLGFMEPVAIKTGTSTGSRDMWLFAITSQFTVGIWAGNFDMSPAADEAVAMELLAPVAQALLRDLGVR
jgi:penicillin-binding protein 1C